MGGKGYHGLNINKIREKIFIGVKAKINLKIVKKRII